MKSFAEISTNSTLSESSLSRVMQHIKGENSFGVISPFRKENSKQQNKEKLKELVAEVRAAGFGFIPMRGGYLEKRGFVNEESLFIPLINRKTIINLGVEFDQESIIHKDKTSFAMISTNEEQGIGKVLSKFATSGKSIKVDDVGDKFVEFFSKLAKGSHKGKKFLFRIVEEVDAGMYHRMVHGDMWRVVFERQYDE